MSNFVSKGFEVRNKWISEQMKDKKVHIKASPPKKIRAEKKQSIHVNHKGNAIGRGGGGNAEPLIWLMVGLKKTPVRKNYFSTAILKPLSGEWVKEWVIDWLIDLLSE